MTTPTNIVKPQPGAVSAPVAPAYTGPESPLQGFNVLLQGPSGTGKTFCIGTLLDAGLKVNYLSLEAGMESLLGYFADSGKPIPENLSWMQVKGPRASFAELQDAALKVNTLPLDALAKLQDTNRAKYDQFVNIYRALSNFIDARTGKSLGPADSWRTDTVLVIDGLTGINNASLASVTGGKPVRSQSDWGLAQVQVENLLRKLTDDCRCHLVILAHVERETDQILGGVKLTVATLGKALAPKIPAMFSDVILAVRTGEKYLWDTSNPSADAKTCNLPYRADNLPSFAPILQSWQRRGGIIER